MSFTSCTILGLLFIFASSNLLFNFLSFCNSHEYIDNIEINTDDGKISFYNETINNVLYNCCGTSGCNLCQNQCQPNFVPCCIVPQTCYCMCATCYC